MRRDLSDEARSRVESLMTLFACDLHDEGESLAIAREAMINAFDAAAEDLANDEGS